MTKRLTSAQITRAVKQVADRGSRAENALIDQIATAMRPLKSLAASKRSNPRAHKTTLP